MHTFLYVALPCFVGGMVFQRFFAHHIATWAASKVTSAANKV